VAFVSGVTGVDKGDTLARGGGTDTRAGWMRQDDYGREPRHGGQVYGQHSGPPQYREPEQYGPPPQRRPEGGRPPQDHYGSADGQYGPPRDQYAPATGQRGAPHQYGPAGGQRGATQYGAPAQDQHRQPQDQYGQNSYGRQAYVQPVVGGQRGPGQYGQPADGRYGPGQYGQPQQPQQPQHPQAQQPYAQNHQPAYVAGTGAAAGAVAVGLLGRPGIKTMLAGVGLFVFGLVITIGTYLFTNPGGTYLVVYGPIIFGIVYIIKGFIQMLRG
jgi:hypothetical protein